MFKLKSTLFAAIAFAVISGISFDADACTGISLKARDGSKVIGRTMEWGAFKMESHVIVVPRGHSFYATTPSGAKGQFVKAKYGYAGIGVLEERFLAEGINEKGMVGELFYFPGYGEFEQYDPKKNSTTVTDAQFLDWVLSNFATIEEMEKELGNIHFVSYGKGFESAHYGLADATGRQVVVEYYDGKFNVLENTVGVLTNSPEFTWHLTNLNNYINVFAGIQPERQFNDEVKLRSFGMGSSSLGLPGDLTPPSRFVRAAFYVGTARPQKDGFHTVKQVFQILNNFDIPIGAEFTPDEDTPEFLSGTQWTTAIDIKAKKFYYRTEWNYTIRCIDLNLIDFGTVRYQELPMDTFAEYPVENIIIR